MCQLIESSKGNSARFIKKHPAIAMERPPLKLEKAEALQMRRSKLEMNVDILKVLAHTGPLKITHIMNKTNVNYITVEKYLGFLIKQGLVEKRTLKKRSEVFAVTERGIKVLRYFRELTQVPLATEEV